MVEEGIASVAGTAFAALAEGATMALLDGDGRCWRVGRRTYGEMAG